MYSVGETAVSPAGTLNAITFVPPVLSFLIVPRYTLPMYTIW